VKPPHSHRVKTWRKPLAAVITMAGTLHGVPALPVLTADCPRWPRLTWTTTASCPKPSYALFGRDAVRETKMPADGKLTRRPHDPSRRCYDAILIAFAPLRAPTLHRWQPRIRAMRMAQLNIGPSPGRRRGWLGPAKMDGKPHPVAVDTRATTVFPAALNQALGPPS